MQKFFIEVLKKKPRKVNGLLSYTGQITIDEFQETFLMPIENWDIEQYKEQWQHGLQRIKTENTSCLITSLYGFPNNPSIEMWTLHRENDIVYFHNQLIIPQTTTKDIATFDEKTCYIFINQRIANHENEAVNDDGDKISEWKIDINDMFSTT